MAFPCAGSHYHNTLKCKTQRWMNYLLLQLLTIPLLIVEGLSIVFDLSALKWHRAFLLTSAMLIVPLHSDISSKRQLWVGLTTHP